MFGDTVRVKVSKVIHVWWMAGKVIDEKNTDDIITSFASF